jgi:hypothetical protein
MDARRRLFALLVALCCAMGWAPTASARGSEDRVVSGESRGVLPGRSPEAPPAEPSAEGDDDSARLPSWPALPAQRSGVVVAPRQRDDVDRRVTRRVRPAGPRGPPSIG